MIAELRVKDYGDLLAFVDDQAFWDAWRDKLVPLVEEVFGIVFRAGAQAGLTIEPATKELLPLDPEAINNAFDRIVTTYTDEWWRQFIPSTQRQMRDAIRRAQAMGTGVEGVIDDLEGIFGTQRAMTIAATETTRLFGLGAQAAYSAAGLDQWEWQTVEDFAVCAICRDRNKTRHPISVPFAPAHPRCRCFPRPVVDASTPDPGATRRRRPRDGETDVQEPAPQPANAYPRDGFKTQAEVEMWLRRKYDTTDFQFSGFDIKSMNHVAREFDRLATLYPDVAKRLWYVGSSRNTPEQYKGAKAPKGYIAYATQNGRIIMLNSGKFSDSAKLNAMEREGQESGWFPKIADGVPAEAATLSHEWGHMLDFFMRQPATLNGYARASGLGLAGDTLRIWRDLPEIRKAGREISQYARTDQDEMFAESFSALQHGTPAAKANAYVQGQAKFLEIFDPSKWQTRSSNDIKWVSEIEDAALRRKLNREFDEIRKALGIGDLY